MKIASINRALGEKPKSEKDALIVVDDVLVSNFFAFIKPFDSDLPDNHPKNYYFEWEWRRLGYLLFQPSDIVRVLVAGDYVERLKQDRPMYSGVVTPAPK